MGGRGNLVFLLKGHELIVLGYNGLAGTPDIGECTQEGIVRYRGMCPRGYMLYLQYSVLSGQ